MLLEMIKWINWINFNPNHNESDQNNIIQLGYIFRSNAIVSYTIYL